MVDGAVLYPPPKVLKVQINLVTRESGDSFYLDKVKVTRGSELG